MVALIKRRENDIPLSFSSIEHLKVATFSAAKALKGFATPEIQRFPKNSRSTVILLIACLNATTPSLARTGTRGNAAPLELLFLTFFIAINIELLRSSCSDLCYCHKYFTPLELIFPVYGMQFP